MFRLFKRILGVWGLGRGTFVVDAMIDMRMGRWEIYLSSMNILGTREVSKLIGIDNLRIHLSIEDKDRTVNAPTG